MELDGDDRVTVWLEDAIINELLEQVSVLYARSSNFLASFVDKVVQGWLELWMDEWAAAGDESSDTTRFKVRLDITADGFFIQVQLNTINLT